MSDAQPHSYRHVIVPAPIRAPNGFGVAALVLGIFGIVSGGTPLFVGLILSFVPALAITFGVLGIVRSNRAHFGFGLSLAGLIIGGDTFLLWFTGYGIIWELRQRSGA